jgi:hypothetical protein
MGGVNIPQQLYLTNNLRQEIASCSMGMGSIFHNSCTGFTI